MKLKAVICRFSENLDWVKDLRIPFEIYNKGDFYPNTKSIPNEGRESEAFLRFILENYSDLPEAIAFLQGDPFSHCRQVLKSINEYVISDQLIYLGDFIPTDDIFGSPHHPGLNIKGILSELGMPNEDQSFTFSAGAQYIVPRERILSKSYDWWNNAYSVHAKHKDSPWAFERIWPTIFSHCEITS